MSARLEQGDRRAYFEAAAARDYVTPDGRIIRLSWRTIEAWYYAHKRGGLQALMPESRNDAGVSRAVAPEIADLVVRCKREKPRRTIRRIIRMLERAGAVRRGALSKSSVHRLLSRSGISARPARGDHGHGGSRVERRSFIAEHVGDLWVGDALHVHRPVVLSTGRVGKAYLLSQIDSASRFVPHSEFRESEEAADQEHGLREAILKYGPPRAYYVDRGAAYVAGSLTDICADLSCLLLHAGKQDAEAKGVIATTTADPLAATGGLVAALLEIAQLFLRCSLLGRPSRFGLSALATGFKPFVALAGDRRSSSMQSFRSSGGCPPLSSRVDSCPHVPTAAAEKAPQSHADR